MDAIDFSHHNEYAWLVAAVLLMAAEALGISGVGLMFAGLGAVVAGALVHIGWIANEAYVSQFIAFFIASALWAYALWKPIQKFHSRKHDNGYRNIVGDTAYVGSQGLSRKTGGEVTWSGTIMKAQLARNSAVEVLEAGSQVLIIDVNGATLIVKPKE